MGEEGERYREGQGSHGACLLWEEGEDAGGLVEGELGEEQAWEGRVQEEVRAVEAEVRVERLEGLVRCREEGAQGTRIDRLCRDRGQVRGWQVPLRQGEVLALSSPRVACSLASRVVQTVRLIKSAQEARQGLPSWFPRGVAAGLGVLRARCTRMLRSHSGAER